MDLKLYEIRAEYDQLIRQAEEYAYEHDGVIPDDLSDQIDRIGDTLEAKAINCGHIYKSCKAEAEAIGDEIARLQGRKKHAENVCDAMKRYLAINVIPGMKIDTPTVAISWRRSEETVVEDMSLLPTEYQKVTIEARKTDIKTAIRSGKDVPGCKLVEKQNILIK